MARSRKWAQFGAAVEALGRRRHFRTLVAPGTSSSLDVKNTTERTSRCGLWRPL